MQRSPARHPLNERSLNTLADPGVSGSVTKTNLLLKRQIHDVDSPEYPLISSRFRPDQDSPRIGAQIVSIMTEKTLPMLATANTQTTQPRQDVEEGDSQETFKDSVLSGTDIDPMEDTMASQQTAATEISQVDRSTASLHAELLRLRLRVAMFKIRTGQTNIPMSLCVPPKPAPFSVRIPATQIEGITAAPKLLPAPVLQPTAYSARMTYPPHPLSSPLVGHIDSPAEQTQLETKDPEDVFRTPALPRRTTITIADHRLSTPPDGLRRMSGNGLDQDRELTSSTIRGNAARDLLGLMQSR